MNILETKRLVLREQSAADAPFVYTLMNSPGWLKYIGYRGVDSVEDARNYILNGAMKSYVQNGFGLWLVEVKEGDISVGICGLIKRPGLEQVDIGFAFLPEQEGMGYGFESASAVMRYAKNVLKLPAVVAITVEGNEPSIKLLNKLGLSFKQMISMPGDSDELMLFEQTFS